MRVISIIGTDWRGPEHRINYRPDGTAVPWRRQPFADGGRLQFNRTREEDWRNVFYELCDIARIPCIAIGIRGAYTDYDTNWRDPAKAAWRAASPQPSLIPWFDTVGLPDMVNAPNRGDFKFDFANGEHIHIGWEKYARVFFDAFADCTLERSTNGKVLIPWWGIETPTGHGFTNQRHAQRLLDFIDQKCFALGLGGADHIVDHTWLKLCPGLQVYGVHDWFNGWSRPPVPYTIRTHNGVTVGVAVPSFYEQINPDGNAATITQALAAMTIHHPPVDLVLIESGTNFQEDAELMRDASGNTWKLDAVRAFTEPITEGAPGMSAAGTTPLFTFDHRAVIHNADGTKSLRWNKAEGRTDHTSNRVFSLQNDGSYDDRPLTAIGPWEKGKPEDHFLVFRTDAARAVFPWQD